MFIRYIKKLIYEIIKFPLIFIFIKTPLINILKKRFKSHRSLKKNNKVWILLDTIFQKEYFNKLKDKIKLRELTNSTLSEGEGRKWALHYYNNHFQTLENLKKRKKHNLPENSAKPIFEKMINFIKTNITDKENTYVIQIGSSSGRDLDFFKKIFPKLNFISTEINDEILDFQKEKYIHSNFKYFKCYAEDIDDCINHFDISQKNIIIFSIESLQYVNPFFLEDFFLKSRKYKNLNLFIYEPIALKFIDKDKPISESRGNISFSHRYDEYAKNSGLNIIESKIIKYLENDGRHFHTGNIYLELKN